MGNTIWELKRRNYSTPVASGTSTDTSGRITIPGTAITNGGTYVFTIRDSQDPNCKFEKTFDVTCTTVCEITNIGSVYSVLNLAPAAGFTDAKEFGRFTATCTDISVEVDVDWIYDCYIPASGAGVVIGKVRENTTGEQRQGVISLKNSGIVLGKIYVHQAGNETKDCGMGCSSVYPITAELFIDTGEYEQIGTRSIKIYEYTPHIPATGGSVDLTVNPNGCEINVTPSEDGITSTKMYSGLYKFTFPSNSTTSEKNPYVYIGWALNREDTHVKCYKIKFTQDSNVDCNCDNIGCTLTKYNGDTVSFDPTTDVVEFDWDDSTKKQQIVFTPVGCVNGAGIQSTSNYSHFNVERKYADGKVYLDINPLEDNTSGNAYTGEYVDIQHALRIGTSIITCTGKIMRINLSQSSFVCNCELFTSKAKSTELGDGLEASFGEVGLVKYYEINPNSTCTNITSTQPSVDWVKVWRSNEQSTTIPSPQPSNSRYLCVSAKTMSSSDTDRTTNVNVSLAGTQCYTVKISQTKAVVECRCETTYTRYPSSSSAADHKGSTGNSPLGTFKIEGGCDPLTAITPVVPGDGNWVTGLTIAQNQSSDNSYHVIGGVLPNYNVARNTTITLDGCDATTTIPVYQDACSVVYDELRSQFSNITIYRNDVAMESSLIDTATTFTYNVSTTTGYKTVDCVRINGTIEGASYKFTIDGVCDNARCSMTPAKGIDTAIQWMPSFERNSLGNGKTEFIVTTKTNHSWNFIEYCLNVCGGPQQAGVNIAIHQDTDNYNGGQ